MSDDYEIMHGQIFPKTTRQGYVCPLGCPTVQINRKDIKRFKGYDRAIKRWLRLNPEERKNDLIEVYICEHKLRKETLISIGKSLNEKEINNKMADMEMKLIDKEAIEENDKKFARAYKIAYPDGKYIQTAIACLNRKGKKTYPPKSCEDCKETFTPEDSKTKYCPKCSSGAARVKRHEIRKYKRDKNESLKAFNCNTR
jgi:hypothetical protein